VNLLEIKQNIGILNALIRITCGLTVLAWSTSKMVKRPWRDSYLIMAIMGAMKVGEGIVRYCPVTDLIKSNVGKNQQDVQNTEDQMVPYNPS
jgi:hypothetical protein